MSTTMEPTHLPGVFSSAETRADQQREGEVCKKLAHKVAVITGGSTGMGLATAKRFALEGADHVFILGRRTTTGRTARLMSTIFRVAPSYI